MRAFLAAHPAWDGRGVLIGIMDSGIDGGTAGLDSTSTGRPKLVDLRDFSEEGRVQLSVLAPTGDTVVVGGQRLGGFGRIRAYSAQGPWYGGVLRERLLAGEPGAADANDNGSDGDTLAVVVAKASDGWVLLADTDGDGSLSRERAVHDYLVARETFGWHRSGEPPPLTLAVNFTEQAGVPRLDLFFDTSAHGTHVSGIAAGHVIGGVPGFDGVAPGAQLLGLKIGRNDFGGITTTGSTVAALDYAIRFATSRGMPLVLNMSFGIGNEREGAARIDAIIDSVLEAHPDIVFVTSAGNDGPGLSTMGFPGSARRAITVGATEPWALSAGAANGGRPAPDVLLFFSSRGGELAKPDVVAPGIAYSTVPRWNMGDEFKGGTSMSSPHVAGLAAILLSGALQERRSVTALDVRRALTGSGVPVAGETPLDAGAGVPSLAAAWTILRGPAPPAEFAVELLQDTAVTAAISLAPSPSDTVVRFRLRRMRGAGPVDLILSSDVPWIRVPKTLRVTQALDTLTVIRHPPRTAGLEVGSVRGMAPGVAGPLFTLVISVVNPVDSGVAPVRVEARLAAGATRRVAFRVEEGRPFRVETSTASPREHLIAALHQPGGAPILGENGIPGSADTAAALYEVDGRDARNGYYEAVAVATSQAPAAATIRVDHSPVGVRLQPSPADSVVAGVRSLVDSAVAGRLDIGIIGGERHLEVSGTGRADVRTGIPLPAWVHRVVIDVEVPPEQWPHFTDFGVALLDEDGRVLGKNPANYARARLSVELPARASAQEATLVLSPAFAEPASQEKWASSTTIRFEADRPAAVVTAEGDEFHLQPRGSATLHGKMGELPWVLPKDFVPLLLLFAESGGVTWNWQLSSVAPGLPPKS